MKKKSIATFGTICLVAFSLQQASVQSVDTSSHLSSNLRLESPSSWKKFHSVHGNCMVALPQTPEHVNQMMPFPEQGYNLRYDAYISAHEKQAVYMMLIAQYPPFMNESHAEMSLESFLNGLVAHNEDGELIFADLIDFQGHKAMDFFVASKGVYFKGRAIIAQNSLYLLAMECNQNNYLEHHYNHFITSFELIK